MSICFIMVTFLRSAQQSSWCHRHRPRSKQCESSMAPPIWTQWTNRDADLQPTLHLHDRWNGVYWSTRQLRRVEYFGRWLRGWYWELDWGPGVSFPGRFENMCDVWRAANSLQKYKPIFFMFWWTNLEISDYGNLFAIMWTVILNSSLIVVPNLPDCKTQTMAALTYVTQNTPPK